MTDFHAPFLSSRVLWLKLASALYVLAIPGLHLSLPVAWVWPIAWALLLAMLFTYPLAAVQARRFVGTETGVSLGLITLGTLGLFLSPVLLVAAIFGHGLWDLAKHRGHGIPFFGWYVSGCVIVDWLYAGSLLFHLLSGVP